MRVIVCCRVAAALIVAGFPRLIAAEKAAIVAPQSESVSEQPITAFSVRGTVMMGSDGVAAIRDEQTAKISWLEKDAVVGDYIIKEITPDAVVLSNRKTQATSTLSVVKASILESDSTNNRPALYSKAWINSTDNPMLHSTQPLPTEVIRGWEKMTTEERLRVQEYYLNHGWRLVGVETSGAAHTFVWENIYAEERSAVLKQNKRDFEASLSDEQRAGWTSISSGEPIKINGGVMTAEQQAEAARRRAAFGTFKASLDPVQSAKLKNMNDFTQANWTK